LLIILPEHSALQENVKWIFFHHALSRGDLTTTKVSHSDETRCEAAETFRTMAIGGQKACRSLTPNGNDSNEK
jgi:hypothetical protein